MALVQYISALSYLFHIEVLRMVSSLFFISSFGFFYLDMQLIPSEITNILVQEFKLMEQLESKFPIVKMMVVKFHSLTFIFYSSSYKWMTYGEAGRARAAIGSGLIYHGIPKVRISAIIISLIFRSFRTFCLQ